MQLLGLTGGIATGKSIACAFIQRACPALPIIDADAVVRDVVARTSTQRKLASLFPECLDSDGLLDRRLLAAAAFADQARRRALEQLVHPAVMRRVLVKLLWLWIKGAQTVIIDIPLLFEAGLAGWMSEVILIDCSPALHLQRLMHRDGLPLAEARKRIAVQLSMENKRRLSSIIISNNGSVEELHVAVKQALDELLSRRSAFLHVFLYWLFPVGIPFALAIKWALFRLASAF